jgi:hypothetical protein
MSDHPSPAERNLLFGILALQNNLIDRAGLLDGFNRWVERKSRPIGEILVERGALGADERVLLEALVAKQLEKFGGEPQKSLAALSSIGSVRRDLSRIADPELHAHSRGVLHRDPGLAPLRDRDDFRRLLAELFDRGFPADPFAP